MKHRPHHRIALLALPLLLAACGGGDPEKAKLAELDDRLTGTADPAVAGALEDQIMVDPELAGQSNRTALRSTPRPADGAAPPAGTEGDAAMAVEEIEGKPLLRAPSPVQIAEEDCTDCRASGRTLGEAAAVQGRRGKGTCEAKLSYAMDWARRMPPEFPVYPRGHVQEAAGVEGGLCDIRSVSFTTAAPLKSVVDYYYTRARRTGYSAEYVLKAGDHVLGGTREVDDGAYVVFLRPMKRGGTEVDIVASNGR